MKLPYSKSMYAEHTDEHFKIFCPIQEEQMFLNIYIKKDNNRQIPFIFDELMNKYIEQWIDKIESAKKAQSVLYDFFDVCAKLSKERKYPFKLKIVPINLDMVNNYK